MFSGIKKNQSQPPVLCCSQQISSQPYNGIQDDQPPCPRNLQLLQFRGPGLRGLGRFLCGGLQRGPVLWGCHLLTCTCTIRRILSGGQHLHCWRLPMCWLWKHNTMLPRIRLHGSCTGTKGRLLHDWRILQFGCCWEIMNINFMFYHSLTLCLNWQK